MIWKETDSRISTLSNEGYQQLADYMEQNGERIKQEHNDLFNELWEQYQKEWDKLPFEEQLKRHIEADNKLLGLKR